MKKSIFILLITFCAMQIATSKAQDATTILKKVDEVLFSAKDMSATNKMILIDKTGKQEVREAKVIQKGTDKRLFRFTAPASQAGIAFLSLPNDVMYIYMPAFGKERRISTSVKNQNFAGTDFSYDDMEAKSYAAKYSPTLTKTDEKSYTLELVPKTSSDYSKIVMVVNKTHYYPESSNFYDKGNNLVKSATYSFKKIGNYWNPEKIEMTDLKKNHKTQMITTDVKYDQNLSDDEFTVRKLMQ